MAVASTLLRLIRGQDDRSRHIKQLHHVGVAGGGSRSDHKLPMRGTRPEFPTGHHQRDRCRGGRDRAVAHQTVIPTRNTALERPPRKSLRKATGITSRRTVITRQRTGPFTDAADDFSAKDSGGRQHSGHIQKGGCYNHQYRIEAPGKQMSLMNWWRSHRGFRPSE